MSISVYVRASQDASHVSEVECARLGDLGNAGTKRRNKQFGKLGKSFVGCDQHLAKDYNSCRFIHETIPGSRSEGGLRAKMRGRERGYHIACHPSMYGNDQASVGDSCAFRMQQCPTSSKYLIIKTLRDGARSLAPFAAVLAF